MKTQWLVFIILVLCLIITVMLFQFVYYPSIENKIYTQAYNAGGIAVIRGMQQSGNIPYFTNETGNITVKTIPITKLCENIKTQ